MSWNLRIVSFCVWMLPALVLAGDWTQFRGPGGLGVAEDTGLPNTWSKTENLRWVVDLPGRGLSSPVIAGGRVFVTACTGWQHDRLHVLCFDVANGKKLWERQLNATGGTVCHPKTNMAAPTPVTDGKAVFALFATGDIAALDASGDLLWYRSLVGDYPTVGNNVGMAASPILANDTLLVPMENAGESFVAGIDASTGRNRWKAARSREINWVTPLVLARAGRTEALFQSPKELTAYDVESGQKVWSFQGDGLSTIPSPVPGKDMILVPGTDLVALRPGADKAEPKVLWKSNKLKSSTGSPLYYQDRVYAMNSAGVLNCANAADGEVLWQHRLTVKGPYSASPVAAEGKLYLVNEEGTTCVVQVGKEAKELGTSALGEMILATPSIADGAIFLRSDKHVWCISAGKKNL